MVSIEINEDTERKKTPSSQLFLKYNGRETANQAFFQGNAKICFFFWPPYRNLGLVRKLFVERIKTLFSRVVVCLNCCFAEIEEMRGLEKDIDQVERRNATT